MRLQKALVASFVLALAATVQAQSPTPGTNPAERRPAQPNPYPPALYQMNDVSRSLNLSPQQVDQLNQLSLQTQTRLRDNYGKLGTLGQADRETRAAELNRQYNQDWMKGAADIFNQNQMNRYQQLQYQHGGFNSFSDPDVQKRLNFTDKQRDGLRQSIDWSSQQLQEINRTAGTDREKALQMHSDYQRQYQDRFNTYLTPEQQKSWQQMTGESFRFQPAFSPTAPRR